MKRTLSLLLDAVIVLSAFALVGRLALSPAIAGAQEGAATLPAPIELLLKMFGGSIVPPLVVFLGGIVTKCLVSLLSKLEAFFDAHTDKQVAAVLDGGVETAKGIVATIVQSAQAKYVDDAKAKGGDAWTADAQKKIFQDVLADAVAQAKAAAPQWTAQAGAGLQAMISHMIEEAVANMKKIGPAVATALLLGLFTLSQSCASQFETHSIQLPISAPCPAGWDCASETSTVQVSDAQCKSWLSQETVYGALSAGLGVLSGAGGISATFPSTKSDQYILGGSSLGIGVLSAVSSYLDSRVQDNFGQYCVLSPAGH